MEKLYCVVYLNAYGIHYRFRCVAPNKRDARKQCREAMGVSSKDITDIYEEEL